MLRHLGRPSCKTGNCPRSLAVAPPKCSLCKTFSCSTRRLLNATLRGIRLGASRSCTCPTPPSHGLLPSAAAASFGVPRQHPWRHRTEIRWGINPSATSSGGGAAGLFELLNSRFVEFGPILSSSAASRDQGFKGARAGFVRVLTRSVLSVDIAVGTVGLSDRGPGRVCESPVACSPGGHDSISVSAAVKADKSAKDSRPAIWQAQRLCLSQPHRPSARRNSGQRGER